MKDPMLDRDVAPGSRRLGNIAQLLAGLARLEQVQDFTEARSQLPDLRRISIALQHETDWRGPASGAPIGVARQVMIGIKWLEQAKSHREFKVRLPFLRRLAAKLQQQEVAPPAAPPVRRPEETRLYDGGNFSIRLPSRWQVVRSEVERQGGRLRLLAQGRVDGDGWGMVEINVEGLQGRSLQQIVQEAQADSLDDDDFVLHGPVAGADGQVIGFSGYRRVRDVRRNESVLFVRDGWALYSVRVAIREGQAISDLEVARSFRLTRPFRLQGT